MVAYYFKIMFKVNIQECPINSKEECSLLYGKKALADKQGTSRWRRLCHMDSKFSPLFLLMSNIEHVPYVCSVMNNDFFIVKVTNSVV